MCRPSYGTLLLIAASCYVLVSSQAKALQGTNKLDLANHISVGPARGSSAGGAASAAGAVRAAMTEARHKRAMGEYKELTDIIDELEENSLSQKAAAVAPLPPQAQEFDLDSMPPLTYYLLLQKLRQLQSNGEPAFRVRTPRLGRSIDFQQLLDAGGASEEAAGGQFMSRMMKKSVPFKPRLGKRAQVCGSGGD
ncbi:protein hugin [Drosophila obscura]|uniref:protein hugin n=1 Tax=Drosophila obscura TaxID=7282 RepID=UPI001BB224E1|nr:protein hugin [Drosophila obscura]